MTSVWSRQVGTIAGCVVAASVATASAEPAGGSAIAAWTQQLDTAPAVLVRALRPRLAELAPVERCVLGLAYGAHDPSRASIYAAACEAPALTDDAEVEARLRPLRARWKASPLSRVVIITDPPGQPVHLDRFPDEVVVSPATLWLPAATYRVRAARIDATASALPVEREVVVARFSSATVLLELGAAPRPAGHPASAGPARTVDFEEVEAGAAHAGAPPKVEHGSLLPSRFRRRPGVDGALRDVDLAAPAWVVTASAGVVAARAGASWQPGWTIGACARRAHARLSPLLCLDGADRGAPVAAAALGLAAGAELEVGRAGASAVTVGAGVRAQWRPGGAASAAPMTSTWAAAALAEVGASRGRWRVATRLEPGLTGGDGGRELAIVGTVGAALW